MSSIPTLGSPLSLRIPTNLDPTTISDDPRLPAELERIIVELAAHSYPQTWLALLYVCKRFHQWVEPHLYTRISITPTNLACFLQHPLKHKRTCVLLRKRCESLCVSEGVDYFDSLPVLYALSSSSRGSSNQGNGIALKNLSYWATKPSPGALCSVQKELPFPFPQIIQLASSQSSYAPHSSSSSSSFSTNSASSPESSHPAPSPLERLSISIQSGIFSSSGNSFALPSSLQYSLANLTHLEILSGVSPPATRPTHPTHPIHQALPILGRYQPHPLGRNRLLFSGYHHLPALTHLAINSWGSVEDVKRILKECDRGARSGGTASPTRLPTRTEDRNGLWGGGGDKGGNRGGYDLEDLRGGATLEGVREGEGKREGAGQSQRGLKVLILIASSHMHARNTRELLSLLAPSSSPLPPSLSSQVLGNGGVPHKSYFGVDPRVVVLPADREGEGEDGGGCCEAEVGIGADVGVDAAMKEGRRKTWDRWAEAEEIIARRQRGDVDSSCSLGMGGGKWEMEVL